MDFTAPVGTEVYSTGDGVVEDVEDWGITTIEGNTSPEPDYADVVERDGDGYYRKVRHWSELGKFGGFAQIDF